MSDNRLQKYIDRPLIPPGRLKRQCILISDSKGNYLKSHSDLIDQFGYFIDFQCRPGARFADYFCWLNLNLHKKVRQYGNIVLYVWLGTCDLTCRKGRFVELRHTDDISAVLYLKNQINRYLKFVASFSSVKLVFLEIPPYSIVEWNKSKGHRNPGSFQSQDLILYERICHVNDYIQEVNETKTVNSPRFHLDLMKYRKRKGHSIKSINYSPYKDGIHPKLTLARCWMKRIVSLVFKDCL
ncbi:MAG: hypothetical protein JAY74_16355 [Candidatus Thiodiazotropha taylori]|nr:hypothetical protein [Candidatus Thiodiazotropha taylori]